MKKFAIEIKWGIIFSVGTLLWALLEKMMGWHGEHIEQHAANTYFFIIPAIHICASGITAKRNEYYFGKMTWKQGFWAGMGIITVVIVLSPLLLLVAYKILSPEFFPNAIEHAVESGKMSLENAERNFNFKNYMFKGIISGLLFGVVTSSIVAIFVKKK